MKQIYNQTITDLNDYFLFNNLKTFRSVQLFEWLYQSKINNFKDITNMKNDVIEMLVRDFKFPKINIIEKQTDVDVYKYLFKLEDGHVIEAVLMKQSYGNSLCVSTQVGCNMGCHFCESGLLKKIRNLETYEMVFQILAIEEDLDLRISHIVLMGIGEPMDNYGNVIDFINIINHPKGINIGARHITISTSGVIPKIEQFIKDGGQVNLAISLHAPNDNIRNQIMPINKAYLIKELIAVLKKYIKITNRRVTIEYIMLRGINDLDEHAVQLAQLLRGLNCYVNLIPYNETSHIKFQKSEKERILQFYDVLKKNKINVTIRKEFGSKLDAACGQLSAKYKEDL